MTEHHTHISKDPDDPSGGAILWSGLFIPGVAWLLHFLTLWALAEYGCVAAGFPRFVFLGVMNLAWGVLAATLFFLGICVVTGRLAYRRWKVCMQGVSDHPDAEKWVSDRHMALAGLYSSFLFGFIIVVETIPIFYYLERC